MLYESAARADEVLCLNVEDLYPQDKRGRIIAKGGATEWIHRQSGTSPNATPLHVAAGETRRVRTSRSFRHLSGTHLGHTPITETLCAEIRGEHRLAAVRFHPLRPRSGFAPGGARCPVRRRPPARGTST